MEFTKILPRSMKHTCFVVLIALCGCRTADLPICISANELAGQYIYNQTAAAAKYKSKALVVKGLVHSVGANGRAVDLQTEHLFIVRASGTDFSSLRKGQEVTLRCQGDGTFAPITVSSCSIVSPETACAAEQQLPVNPASSTYVELTLMAELRGQSVTLAGTSNLKDGAVLSYEVEHELFDLKNKAFADGDAIVKAGRYSATVNVAGWPRGTIKVWVGFQTVGVKGQPKWVKDQYGELGQKMEGPVVKVAGQGVKRAELEVTVIKP
jgi:hypothetical protein